MAGRADFREWLLDQPFVVDKEAMARAAVVAEARGWLGTPYHHAADVRGPRGGVDCVMLLVRVFCDLGLVEPFDPRPYVKDWFLHRSEERYLAGLFSRAHEVATPALGDVALFRLGRCYAHGGIVSKLGPLSIIHAYANAGGVVENSISVAGPHLRDAKFASLFYPKAEAA